MENSDFNKNTTLTENKIYIDFMETKKLINDAFDYQYSKLRNRRSNNKYYEKGVAFAVYSIRFPKFISKILFKIKSAIIYMQGNISNYNTFIEGYTNTIN